MEKELSFVLMLSLKEITLRKVTVHLWTQPDILASILQFPSVIPDRFSITVQRRVINRKSKLVLPESLLKQLSLSVPPIGLQLLKWKLFHKRYFEEQGWQEILIKYLIDSHVELDAPILSKLCWTMAGTVDYKKTAEVLVRCEMVDIVKRYQLACLYCLDDWIPALWEELPEEIKRKLYNERDTSQIASLNLQVCWPYILKGELSKLDCIATKLHRRPITFYQYAFEYSVREGNKAATEYFFPHLTEEEKESSLVRTAGAPPARNLLVIVERLLYDGRVFPPECFSDLLCYLLSLMNHEQQMETFKKHSYHVLRYFMTWPWHDLFLKIADRVAASIPTEHYDYLLREMNVRFEDSKYFFPKLFREFFPHSPMHFRKAFVDRECSGSSNFSDAASFNFHEFSRRGKFFHAFFDFQDSETIKVIFRNVSAADRVRLVSSEAIFQLFHYYILKGECDMVRLCLQEATLSMEDRERLKEASTPFAGFDFQNKLRNKFRELLEEIDASARGKRIAEDETENKAKKLCSDE